MPKSPETDTVPESGGALVVFMPTGRRGRFAHGTPLLQAARTLGVDIDSVCGGRGICGRCQVIVGDGDYAKLGIRSAPDHLGALAANELRFDARDGLAKGVRLSCSARLAGDVVIDVPASSQIHRQVIRKRTDARIIEIDPIVRPLYVEFDGPDNDAPGDRLRAALRAQWDITPQIPDAVAAQLLGDEDSVTVALREEAEIVALWPGFRAHLHGLSVDIGSTTVAAQLCHLGSGEILSEAGMMNPQIRFGEDVMSRVSHIMMNPGSGRELTAIIRGALSELARDCAGQAGVSARDIVEMTVVGNPIMHHIFLGLDPTPLGQAPFPLAEDGPLTLAAADLDLGLNPGARVHVLPCIAGHVGADTSAMILSEDPHKSDEVVLLVDIGTNAEIVLGNKDRLYACSSPTGPAFEGAQISCGQRAAAGAIERVRIDPATLEPRFKVIGSELWSDDPDFAVAVAGIGVTGICGSGIIEALAELFLRGVIRSDGLIDEAKAKISPRIEKNGETFSYLLHAGPPEISIIQLDIRNIQLAKAAAYAGARLLMAKMGINRVDRIVLTGAFGSYMDPKYAMILGLIPDCDLAKVSAAGNAAGTGARIALLNVNARLEIAGIARAVEKIETAIDPDFQAQFVGAMAFPHDSHGFPQLATAVDLPERALAGPGPRRRGGRRRDR
jgi:uncharacterized 2Fe-2S/4Fe-4S cluster protein (DUF4445 family)